MKRLNEIWVPSNNKERILIIGLVWLLGAVLYGVTGENNIVAGVVSVFGIAITAYALTQGLPKHKNLNKINNQSNMNAIEVAGVFASKQSIIDLFNKVDHKPYYLYSLEGKEIDAKGRLGLRNYKYLIYKSFATFENEPSNKHDKNAIRVMVNGCKIGYVPVKYQDFIRNRNLSMCDIEINGGDYNVWTKANDNYYLNNEENDFYATLFLLRKE